MDQRGAESLDPIPMPDPASTFIRPAEVSDTADFARIYNHYIQNTIISFEEEPVPTAEMAARLATVVTANLPWLTIESGGQVSGFAYASPWKKRSAYRFSAESTIYLHPDQAGLGLGTLLYGALLDELRQHPLHIVIGGIALPNPASVRLHEKLGFRKVAHFSQVGFKFGAWIDVGYWELALAAIASHARGVSGSKPGEP
jgi:L-amino acid N-acyltransferase YncA